MVPLRIDSIISINIPPLSDTGCYGDSGPFNQFSVLKYMVGRSVGPIEVEREVNVCDLQPGEGYNCLFYIVWKYTPMPLSIPIKF